MEDIIFSYYKERYDEQKDRFKLLETKCSLFLRYITMLVAVIGGAISFSNKEIINPVGVDQWIRGFSFAIGTFFVIKN
ncbi:MAG: hypothetical protein D3925_02655 [Candidatus Electrothrix sp. AR5]|nr:hypothetical protein [Candidatus Electrothrix sp. AR5]